MKKLFLAACLTIVGNAMAADWLSFLPSSFDPAKYGTIRLAVDAPYPPYAEFDKNGKLYGFEIELGNSLCEEMGLTCEWQVTAWDTIIQDLNANKFDVIMSSMSITKEREQSVDFGDAYYNTPSVFFARKSDAIGGQSERNLNGKRVAVQRGTLQHDHLMEEYGNGITILAMDGWDDIEAAFRNGEADVVLTDYPQWEEKFFIERKYEILGEVLYFGKGVGLAFRQDDDDLRKAMNKGMAELKRNGEYQRVRRKYFLYDIMVD